MDFQRLKKKEKRKTEQIFQYMVDKKILHFHKYNIFFDKFCHLKKIDNFNKSSNIMINVQASIVFFVTNICNLVRKNGCKMYKLGFFGGNNGPKSPHREEKYNI